MADSVVKLLFRIDANTEALVSAQQQFINLRSRMREVAEMTKLGAVFEGTGIGLEAFTETMHEAVTASSRLAAEIERSSGRLGLNAEQYQVLSRVALGAETSVEEFSAAQNKSNEVLGKAIQGNSEAAATFNRLHLSIGQLSGAEPQQQMELYARAIGQLPTQMERSAAAMELFGRGGTAMLPLLDRLAKEGYGGLRASVEQTSGILSEDLVQSLAKARTAAEEAEQKISGHLAGINLTLLQTKQAALGFLGDYRNALAVAAGGYAAIKLAEYAREQLGAEAATRRHIAAINEETAALVREEAVLKSLASAESRRQAALANAARGGVDPRTNIKSAADSAAVFMQVEASASRTSQLLPGVQGVIGGLVTSTVALLSNPFTWLALAATAATAALDTWQKSIDEKDAASEALYQRVKKRDKDITDLRSESDRKAQRAALVESLDKIESAPAFRAVGRSQRKIYTDDQQQEMGSLRKQISILDGPVATAKIKTNQDADADRERLVAAQQIAKKLDEQAESYRKQAEASRLAQVGDEEKLHLLGDQAAKAIEQYQIDVRAADLAGDQNARAAAMVKFEATSLEIAQKRSAVEKDIAAKKAAAADAEKRAADEAAQKAARTAAEAARRQVDAEAEYRSRIDNSRLMTDEEKSAARLVSLQKEQVQLAAQSKALHDQADAARGQGHESAAVTLDGRADDLDHRSAALPGQIAQNTPLAMSDAAQAGTVQFFNTIPSMAQIAANGVESAWGGMFNGLQVGFSGLLNRTMTLGQAGKAVAASFGSSMLQSISKIGAEYAMLAVKQVVFYLAAKAKMFLIDQLFAAKSLAMNIASAAKSLISWLPSAAAASISSYGVAAAVGVAAVIAAIASFREQGGPVTAGQPYIVGERRAELFVPTQNGYIYPTVEAGLAATGAGAAPAASFRAPATAAFNSLRFPAPASPAFTPFQPAAAAAATAQAGGTPVTVVFHPVSSEAERYANSRRGQVHLMGITGEHRAELGINT